MTDVAARDIRHLLRLALERLGRDGETLILAAHVVAAATRELPASANSQELHHATVALRGGLLQVFSSIGGVLLETGKLELVAEMLDIADSEAPIS